MKLIALHTYPIKGTRGLSHDAIFVEPRGFKGDRRWMIVDENNNFITQREVAALASISAQHTADGLSISSAHGSCFDVKAPDGTMRATVQVWGDSVDAAIADDDANAAISATIGRSSKLAYMDQRAARLSDSYYSGANKPVSFADGFPVLITSQASLTALNAHIETSSAMPVSMERFRPNIMVDGESAWDEDTWSVVQLGEVVFDAVKPCTRCVVTTRDQKTGVGSNDAQPIRALTKIRRSNDKNIKGVLFGVNLVPRAEGDIGIGDDFRVLERRKEPWPVAKI